MALSWFTHNHKADEAALFMSEQKITVIFHKTNARREPKHIDKTAAGGPSNSMPDRFHRCGAEMRDAGMEKLFLLFILSIIFEIVEENNPYRTGEILKCTKKLSNG